MPDAVADAQQELRQDGARIAAGAIERGIGNPVHELARVRVRPVAQRQQHGVQRQREVGAGVPVRDREDVDLVDDLFPRQQPVDAGAQGQREARTVEGICIRGNGAHGGGQSLGSRNRWPR